MARPLVITAAVLMAGDLSWVFAVGDFAKLPPETPRAIRDLVERCLDRNVKTRLRDIGEARIAIENVGKEPDAAIAVDPTSRFGTLPWIAAGVMTAIAAVSLWAPWRTTESVDGRMLRLDVDLGSDVQLPAPTSSGSSVAISPDGTRLAFASGTPRKLFVRRLDQPNASELPSTTGAQGPFFSPDGQWVGFASGGKLIKTSVEGGSPIPLGDVSNFLGASWCEDGSIVVGGALGQGMLRISPGGRPPEILLPLGGTDRALARPQVLPGCKAVLFTTSTSSSGDIGRFNIEVLTLADHKRKVIAHGGSTARYLPTSNGIGHLIYTNKATLFAIPFDLEKLETRGTAVPVLDDVAYDTQFGGGGLDCSRTGTLVYRKASASVAAATSTVQWVDAAGNRKPLGTKPGVYSAPSLSPDGRQVALLFAEEGRPDVWVYNCSERP